jgi:cell division protein FtsW
VVLFLIFLWKGFSVAIKTRDGLSRLIVSGVTIWIAVQAMVNMGSAIGVFPVVGVPLPLVSYGGSSLISTLVAVALMLRVVDKSSR